MIKTSWSDLALFGGQPLFSEPLHVGRPNIGCKDNFFRRVEAAFDRRWLTNDGVCVRELESRLAAFLSVRHCILVSNGTVALELAIRALRLTGEIILPSFTFIATAHAIQWAGLTPVFCDIDPQTCVLDPVQVERLINEKTSAIMGVHVWGKPCAIPELTRLSQQRGLKLIFDAAHAFGCSWDHRMISAFGDAEVFSFHATKFFNTFEGGAVVTESDALARELRLMRNFGFTGHDQVAALGINGKMHEISACMGLNLLDNLDEILETNRRHYQQYHELAGVIPGLNFIRYNEKEKNNYQYIIARVGQEFGLTRDQLVELLFAENIVARRYFYPGCHKLEPYASMLRYASLQLPHTDRLADSVISFPTGTAVQAGAVKRIADFLSFVQSHGDEISAAMQKHGSLGSNN
ncbi:MAG: dTDP-4-dehydro-6-deoxyglucose aminotransferase [Lentisphaerae bacterium GWF2_57_35]|nr:MAG: dTDP-4-dehydro-6-deoxyglucose aminotransferase [Lentisphaerae bacterium GWF2_57_35]